MSRPKPVTHRPDSTKAKAPFPMRHRRESVQFAPGRRNRAAQKKLSPDSISDPPLITSPDCTSRRAGARPTLEPPVRRSVIVTSGSRVGQSQTIRRTDSRRWPQKSAETLDLLLPFLAAVSAPGEGTCGEGEGKAKCTGEGELLSPLNGFCSHSPGA